MIELEGNLVSTTNTRFAHYEREVIDNEQNYGKILFEVGESLLYTPIYIGKSCIIQNSTTDYLKTFPVQDAIIEGNILTVKTSSSVYTFNLKQ